MAHFRKNRCHGPEKPGSTPGFAVSAATARHIHGPCLVMLYNTVKRLLRSKALVNVDHDKHVDEGKRCPLCQYPLRHFPQIV
jgi:hypothetical protein